LYQIEFVARNATAPVAWSKTAGALPPGLSLNAVGVLTGTPISSGIFAFTVRAIDAGGDGVVRSYTVQVTLSFNTLLVRVRDACDNPLPNALVYLSRIPAVPERIIDATGETAFLGTDPPYLVTIGYDDQDPITVDELKSFYLTAQHEIIVHFAVNEGACTPAGSGGLSGSVSNFTATATTIANVSTSSKSGLLQTEQDYAPLMTTPGTPGFNFTSVKPPGAYAASAIGLDVGGQPVAFGIRRNLTVSAGGQTSSGAIALANYVHRVGGILTYPPGVSTMSNFLAYAGYQLNPEGLAVANIQSLTNIGFAPSSYQLDVPQGVVASQDKGILWLETIRTLDDNGSTNILDDVDKRWLGVDGFTIGVFDGTADVAHNITFLPEPTVTAPSKSAMITSTPNINWTMASTSGVTIYRMTLEQMNGSGNALVTVPAWEVFLETDAPFQSGFNLPTLPNSLLAIGGLESGRSYMVEVASANIPPLIGALGFDIERPTLDFRVSLMRAGPVTVQ
ncbi:MAG: Ig domain-containing protein, partial [bacterium]